MTNIYYRIKVLIADDHEMVRDGLMVMSRKIEEFEIIGEATNGEELVQLTHKLNPDVILTDVKMPSMSGPEAVRIIKAAFPQIGILALSSYDEQSLILDMLNAGAQGYLLKNTGKKELTEAILAAHKGQPYYSKEIKDRLADLIAAGGRKNKGSRVQEQFSDREREVIRWICEGLPSKQIADKMNIRPRTVERYRDNIMDKMGVKNVASVVMFAVQHQLVQPSIERK
jgi:DNA-binding NarL/FixJ family response regulator